MAEYTPKNMMVTGGAGFIGCIYVRYMLETDEQVRIVNLDELTYAGSLDNLEGLPDESRHTFVQGEKGWGQAQCRSHHISTDEVYGTLEVTDPAFSETTPYAPNSPYSASKAGSDHLVRAYFHTYDLPVTTTNCSNNYGPYQHGEKFIPTVIRSCVEQKAIPVYGDDLYIRDWLYVRDHLLRH